MRAVDAAIADVERVLEHLDPVDRHEQTGAVCELLDAWYWRLDDALADVPLPGPRPVQTVDTNGRT